MGFRDQARRIRHPTVSSRPDPPHRPLTPDQATHPTRPTQPDPTRPTAPTNPIDPTNPTNPTNPTQAARDPQQWAKRLVAECCRHGPSCDAVITRPDPPDRPLTPDQATHPTRDPTHDLASRPRGVYLTRPRPTQLVCNSGKPASNESLPNP